MEEHSEQLSLSSVVQQIGTYLTKEELKSRDLMLDDIQKLAEIWACGIIKEKICETLELETYTKLVAFGGQALGVVSKGGDIDALLLVCKHLTREDFFYSFYKLLSEHVLVSEHKAVEGAYVPLIHIVYKGVLIDICICCLPFETIPQDLDLNANEILKGLDRLCIRSLSGVRHLDALLSLVPCEDTFKETYKAVKVWAKARCIYKSAMGYPGGIALAVMVAKVCQMNPNASIVTLVYKFFKVYSEWIWPRPVRLREEEDDIYSLQQWNPRVTASDRSHITPVITPSYPVSNCMYSAFRSTKTVINNEINTGLKTVTDILEAGADSHTWMDLFTPLRFFRLYKHFIMLTASATTEQDMLDWCGMVESKLKYFVQLFEEQPVIKLAHPFTKTYRHQIDDRKPSARLWFLGLQFNKAESINLDLSADTRNFQKYLFEEAMVRRIYKPGMEFSAAYMKRKQLEDIVPLEELQK